MQWPGHAWLVVLMMPALAHAQPASPDSVRASLVVDASASGSGQAVIARRIEERANVVLRREAVLPGDASSMRIEIDAREVTGDAPGYELEVGIFRPDRAEPEASRLAGCPLCTESELVALAEREVAALVPRLRALDGETGSKEPARPAPSDEAAASSRAAVPAPADHAQPDARARVPVIVGATLAGVGLAGVGTGIGLVLREPRPDSDPRYEVSTRNPGYAALAIGGALVVSGVAVLALGLERRRKATAWAPWLGPGGAGLAMHTRF